MSAAMACTPISAYGSDSTEDGWNDSRYSSSAGSVFCALKWWANANGSPSAPATWALNPL